MRMQAPLPLAATPPRMGRVAAGRGGGLGARPAPLNVNPAFLSVMSGRQGVGNAGRQGGATCAQAVKRGKVARRVGRRAAGKVTGRALRKLFG